MAMFEGPNKIAEAMQARRAAYEATPLGQEALQRGNDSLARRTAINQAAADAPILSPEEQPPTGSAFSGRTMFDRLKDFANRGGAQDAPRPISMPQPAVSFSTGAAPGAAPAMQAATPAAQPVGITYKDYISNNPESQFDKDIEFTHTLSRALGMVGLGDKAMAARDSYMKLNAARIQDVGTQAQRAFVAGDVTKGIDMFNHMIPNGEKIVGYAKKPDGTYSFKMQDGTTVDRTPEQMQGQLAAMTNPAMIGAMMQKRAEIGATAAKEQQTAMLKGRIDFNKMVAEKQLSHESAAIIKQAELDGKQVGVHQPPLGSTGGPVFTIGNKAYQEKMQPGLSGQPPRMVMTEVPLPAQPRALGGGAVQPASRGTMIDAARFAAALGTQQ